MPDCLSNANLLLTNGSLKPYLATPALLRTLCRGFPFLHLASLGQLFALCPPLRLGRCSICSFASSLSWITTLCVWKFSGVTWSGADFVWRFWSTSDDGVSFGGEKDLEIASVCVLWHPIPCRSISDLADSDVTNLHACHLKGFPGTRKMIC